MTSFRIRPRFKVITSKTPTEIQQDIQQRLHTHTQDCIGTVIQGHIVLKIPIQDQHYWSPQLSLNLEEEENSTVIYGLYGPKPTVWAMFTFGYATIGILALFVGITGLSKVSLGKSAFELWAIPAFAIIALVLYVLSQIGQKIGAEQTFTLHHFFEEATGLKVHVH
jgi:hypothetical protein